jgi:hypothetical protein
MKALYYLKMGPGMPWQEVTEETYVQAEREAGFFPKGGMPKDKPATSSFSVVDGVAGKIRYDMRGAINPMFKQVEG